MAADSKRVQTIFQAAVVQDDAACRQTVLERECAGDAELRFTVEALLRAHDEPDTLFVDEPRRPAGTNPPETLVGAASPAPPLPIADRSSSRIGPYKLLEKLGDGGMGTVYRAEQETPVRRQVALKIIKPGMDSDLVIARFEAERQALALMDHQNIARVFDAATTDAGRPYFVMELVHGVPITDYCDNSQLTPRARLELFVSVCQAIQHAHQKGIIHRDIKPSNVLVTLYDGKPVPKVIDFGVAKAIEQRQTERTIFTQYGSIIGTPEYMSPEQAGASALGVDTRSDIYSLGVLLYELLTGTTPLEHERLIGAGYDEILKRIRDEEPPKPSTRLISSKLTLPGISAYRRTDPQRLPRLYRGELDWIVMKALEKDRSRRYETANGFARDVQRYLDGDAVEACPPSATYRLNKFARKHRAALAATAAFAALLFLGAVLSSWQAIRATRAERSALDQAHRAAQAEQQARLERDRAIEAERRRAAERDRAVAAEAFAKAEEVRANRSAAEAHSVLRFFDTHVLAAARPQGQEGGLGREVTIRQAVDAALAKIAGGFPDQPTVEASIRDELGWTYYYLGEPRSAIRQLERALELRASHLGREQPDTLTSQNKLAQAYQAAGQWERAIDLLERTVAARASNLGSDHPDTLTSQNALALAYRDGGRWDQAIRLFERTLAVESARLGADHPSTLLTQNNLALTFRDDGQWDRAIALFERTLKARASKLGADHPDTLLTQQNLAMAYRESNRWDQAIPMFERTLAAQAARLGADHPYTLLTQNNLAPAYLAVGQTDRAISLLERTLTTRKARLGVDHPSTLSTQYNLALAYQAAGQLDRAIPLFEQTLAALQAKLGKTHPRALSTQNDLALAYQARSEMNRAESILREVIEARTNRLGASHPEVGLSLTALGENLLKQRKWTDAERALRQGMAILEAERPNDWSRFNAQSLIGASLLAQSKYDEAEPLLLAGYLGMSARAAQIPAPSEYRLTEAGDRLVQLYEAWAKPEKAAEWRQKLKQPSIRQSLPTGSRTSHSVSGVTEGSF